MELNIKLKLIILLYIPSVGSKRTIKYDPTNPSNAIITGFNGNFVSIFIGFMFCIIPIFNINYVTK